MAHRIADLHSLRMTTVRRLKPISLLVAVLAVAVAVGCGSSKEEIPADEASALQATLDQLQSEAQSDPCSSGTDETLNAVFAEISDLPSRVDQGIRQGLNELAKNLEDLVIRDCESEQETTSTTDETTTESSTTDTSSTTTDTSSTTTETTTETTTTPTTGTTTTAPGGGDGGISPERGNR